MKRTITVVGVANLTVKPDVIVLKMTLLGQADEYDLAMKRATSSMNDLLSAIDSADFDNEDLKTSYFNIQTEYENYNDENGHYKRRFKGYICEQHVLLEFKMDLKRLSHLLTAIAQANVQPEMNVQFTVKDKTNVMNQLLKLATKNAKEKADILAESSEVHLGDLLKIDYSWRDKPLYSPTNYNIENRQMLMETTNPPAMEPEEISISDTVTFVWEIT